MAVSIAPLVRRCLDLFERLSSSEDAQFRDMVYDELGRFRIWTGNISAHTTGRRSLEYRLRDSSQLSSAVVRYLQELIKVLEAADSLSRQQLPVEPNENQTHDSDRDRDDHDSDDDNSLFAEEDFGDVANRAPYSGLFVEVDEIITCLLRISMSLRNPARNDQIRYAKDVSMKHFEPKDIEHVRTKFPDAADSVVVRLGKAASRHRQYFKYREEHHQKLAERILEDDDKTFHERTSTIATSLDPQTPVAVVRPIFEDSDAESIFTATSYAETASGDSRLRPPPMPDAAEHGPFECPMCYYIITVADERSWRQHVYEDIPPYVCTNAGCKAVSRQYSRRRDWRQHMREHERHWLCPYGCTAAHTSSEDFRIHLDNMHLDQSDNVSTDALVESCARSNTGASALQCPLCFQEKPNFNVWQKHVGHHLEQLALFAIPQHLRGEESDDSDADDSESDVDTDESGEADVGSIEIANDGSSKAASDTGSDSGLFETQDSMRYRPEGVEIKNKLLAEIEEKEKTLGVDHPSTLDTLKILGNLYAAQGELASAEATYRRALQGRERALGPGDLSTLATVNNLGYLLVIQGKLAQAEEMFQRALVGREKALGRDHPSTLNTMANLAATYRNQGRLKEAEELEVEVIVTSKAQVGPNHPSTLRSTANLAAIYWTQGRWEEAKNLQKEAVKGYKKTYGPQDPATLSEVSSLKRMLERHGQRPHDGNTENEWLHKPSYVIQQSSSYTDTNPADQHQRRTRSKWIDKLRARFSSGSV